MGSGPVLREVPGVGKAVTAVAGCGEGSDDAAAEGTKPGWDVERDRTATGAVGEVARYTVGWDCLGPNVGVSARARPDHRSPSL